MKHKISVIVPVYNVAPYLARCLDSLVNQTLKDIEIICIDDKSTDTSLEILRKYEKSDKRIRVIALDKNSGVSVARNTGIAAAHGEYLGFVDSDDYIDLDFYEKLYETAKKSDADIARGNVKITQYDGITTTDSSEIKNIERHGKWYFAWQWWAAIYRTSMIKDGQVLFPEDIVSGEDTVFLVNSLALAKSVLIVPDTYYHYIRREGSLDEQIMSLAKITSRITALETISKTYNLADMEQQDYVSRYTWAIGGLYTHFFKNTTEQSKRLVADAMVRMYTACLDKGAIAKELGDIMGSTGAAYLKSCDANGLFTYLSNMNDKSAGCVQTDTFYLFGAIPLFRVSRSSERFIVHFCGINILKIKSAPKDYRVWVMYIPIVRRKRKYKG